MWTFSNSTWKGQLKNVQDEISRPLGSREIQKTKVETVLWDTLYSFGAFLWSTPLYWYQQFRFLM